MNGYSLLEPTLWDILRVINPTQEDWNVRFHILNDLRATVESIDSLRGAIVEPFGSFASNLFTRWGDLDISVELQNGSYIVSPARKHKQTLLGDILRALRKKAGYRRLQFIHNARVPILKLETNYNISCDISINNLSGQMKSKLLYWINEIDGRFRNLVLLVKEWAKAHHINDSKSGTLNSYSLSLLVVFHLQTLVPAILPPLTEIYPGNMIDDLRGVRAVAEKSIQDICYVNIDRIKSDKSRLINKSTLSELFLSFLAKFSDICSRASTQGVSPYAGQLEDIDTNMRWLPKTYALFVEDPFEQPANTARTVSNNQLIKIAETIDATREILVSPHQNQSSIVMTLVMPHISKVLLGPPLMPNPLSTQPLLRTQPARNQTRPFQMQNRAQNKKVDNRQNNRTRDGIIKTNTTERNQIKPASQNEKMGKRQNGVTNGFVNASTSQNQQQVWRPRSETK